MFRKPFNTKKNTNLRNSDTRKLINRLKEELENELVLIEKKSQVAQVKIVNYQGDAMNLYLFDKTPMLFDFSESGVVYPTVFFLWSFPKSYPVILVHEPVLQYLENGADLMLPGVLRGENYPFPKFRRGGPVAIALCSGTKVTGPVAVGCSMMSSDEMQACGFQGKGVQLLHVFRDSLWEFGPRGPPPSMGTDEFFQEAKNENDDQFLSIENISIEDKNNEDASTEAVSSVPHAETEESIEPVESLVRRCFLAGLKYRLKKSGNLPMDVGQFYAQCVLSCVPEGRRMDMKKTKYKKFATFLDEINSSSEQLVVTLDKKTKGAEQIIEVNWAHPFIREFEPTDEKLVDEVADTKQSFVAPLILEYLGVTEPVMPVLKPQMPSLSKGDLLKSGEVRELLTQYVKANDLQQGKEVKLDPFLANITKINSTTTDWNKLMNILQSKFTKVWMIEWSDGRKFVRKVTPPKIEFKVESRAGNKKVTLINNLAVFGIDIKTISHQIQTKVATSVTSNAEAVNCEGPQLLVQGNQVFFVGEILMGVYGIDKKYIVGLDLAPKKRR
ncbi:unnamed protein product [Caenorhabditis auriculariae]|uniref:SUI1 domain-containing protein n=1 Tax=Caenorhabditis auriculariae TaxID=2777116 RepID=A0A8S1HQB6_9PELO|nr:unnamed protein product [Caenorhabditis auriculariae]